MGPVGWNIGSLGFQNTIIFNNCHFNITIRGYALNYTQSVLALHYVQFHVIGGLID